MRRRHSYPLTSAVLAGVILIAGSPTAATAASYQYALNRHLGDYSTVSSAVAAVAGGKAQLGATAPGGTRVVIQTYSSAIGLLYAASGNGYVSFTHSRKTGVQSRCYWYYAFGPVSGTYPMNCWRYA